MILTSCPRCDREYRLADSLRGQVVACPDCGASMHVEPAEEGEERRRAEGITTPDDLPAPPVGVGAERLKVTRFRKKKKKRRRGENLLLDTAAYYLGGVGAFGWALAGMFACWLVALALTPLHPRLGLGLATLGGVLYFVGSWWIVFIAFRDDAWAGSLCLFTQLFLFAYIYMNVEATWRPAGLMILGLLMVVSGYGSAYALGAFKL
jgi:hypothetical protein